MSLSPLLPALLCLAGIVGCGGPPSFPPLPPLDAGAYPESRLLVGSEARLALRAETSRIDLGTPGAGRHLRDGWLWPEVTDDGTTIVWAAGEASSFDVELTSPRDLELGARGWPYRPPEETPQRVTLWIDGREVESWRMKPGTRIHEVRIPAEHLRAGTNRLTLRPSLVRATPEPAISAAWDYLELSPTQAELPVWEGEDLRMPLGSRAEVFLRLDSPAALSFEALEGERGAHLEVRVASDGPGGEGDPIRIPVQETPGGFELGLDPGSGSRAGAVGDLPLLVRVTLGAVHPGRVDGSLRIRSPRVHRRPASAVPGTEARGPGSLVTARAARESVSASAPPRPNIVLYLVDTLRADRLGCYGGEAETPNIDALAADSILFERTMAQSSWTRSSMASVVTGLDPASHGVESRRDALPAEAITLAELLSAHGYRTAGVLTNGNAGAAFGFDQGFDSFELLNAGEDGIPARAPEVHRRARELLDGPMAGGERPFFLYLHFMEPHAPFVLGEDLPEELRQRQLAPEVVEELRQRGAAFSEDDTGFGSVAWVHALVHRLLPDLEAQAVDLTTVYDFAVSELDRHLGAFLGDLKRRGVYEDTVIVFLSDHGEELHDHGGFSHGRTLYQEQLHVPFLLRLPGQGAPRGVRVPDTALQIDLLPTLLDLLSIAAPPHLEGRSLLPRSRDAAARPGFAQLDLDTHRSAAWLEDGYKLVCPESRPCQLFDLRRDPTEQRDLAAELPIRLEYAKTGLEAHRAKAGVVGEMEVELDPELEESLRALGYI